MKLWTNRKVVHIECHIVELGAGVCNSRGRASDEWAHCGPASSYCGSQEWTLVRCGSRSHHVRSPSLCFWLRPLVSAVPPFFPKLQINHFLPIHHPSLSTKPQPKWGGLPAKCWSGLGSYGNQHAGGHKCALRYKLSSNTLMWHRHELEVNADVQLGHRLFD